MDKIKKIAILLVLIYSVNIISVNKVKALMLPTIKEVPKIENFIGKWEMKTIVTDSNCKEIIIGSTTESELIIKKTSNNGFLHIQWDGGIWTKSKGILKPLTEKEAITERKTEMKLNDNNEWKAELIDHLYMEEENLIHSESIVKQYKNNQLIGEYKTFSILIKVE